MSKYQEALDELETIENRCKAYNANAFQLNMSNLVETNIDMLQECINELAKYKALEQELGCPLENVMALLQVVRNKKYYYEFDDKIYECKNIYVNTIYWNGRNNEICISVSTNNEELIKEYSVYDTVLYAKGYNNYWWVEKPEKEKEE